MERGPDLPVGLPRPARWRPRSSPTASTARARRSRNTSTLFGDRYYLEIQDNHLPEQRAVNEFLIPWSEGDGHPAGRDQRLPLPRARRPRGARGAAVRADRQAPGRRGPLEVRHRPALRQGLRRDAGGVPARAPGASRTSLALAERCNLEHALRRTTSSRSTRCRRTAHSTTCWPRTRRARPRRAPRRRSGPAGRDLDEDGLSRAPRVRDRDDPAR